MDFKTHIETAWQLTWKHIVPLVLITLVMYAVGVVTLGILMPVTMAGYVYAVLLLVREGREPKIQDLFSHMRLFLPLLAFGVVVFIIAALGMLLLVLPGIVFILAVSYFCLYMMPLMVDKNMGVIDAVKESAAIVLQRDKIMDHVVAALVFTGILTIGNSVVVGWLFTQPLATLFLIQVYDREISALPPASPPPAPKPPIQ